MGASDVPTWLTATDITAPVCRLFRSDTCSIADWTCHRLIGGAGKGLGIWRVAGNALTDGTSQPWSVILKGLAPSQADLLPSAWDWPHREREMYRSGLLADLPGRIRTPTCYGEADQPDGSVWLWLEDITDKSIGPWSLDLYAAVARHLGEFNGAYLVDRMVPEDPLPSRGWLQGWVEASAPSISELTEAANHHLVRQVYPPHVAAAYRRLWAERHAYYALLEQLPQTFCHLDAFRRNLFMRQNSDGMDETVVIDWEFAGIATVGEELASLVVASVFFMDVSLDNARQLQATVLASYIDGLQDAGWRGDPDLVRKGYAVAAVLRYGVGSPLRILPFLLDERFHPRLVQLMGRPMSDITATLAGVNDWLVDLILEV